MRGDIAQGPAGFALAAEVEHVADDARGPDARFFDINHEFIDFPGFEACLDPFQVEAQGQGCFLVLGVSGGQAQVDGFRGPPAG